MTEPPPPSNRIFGTALGVIVCGVAFVLSFIVIWQFIRKDVAEMPEYRLHAERVRVPEPPNWVGEGFVAEALRSAGLDADGSLLDKRLPEKLAAAFHAHPWTAEVRSVTLDYPGGATVDLVYRQPVALIDSNNATFPVDANGVLLRSDFLRNTAPDECAHLPHIGPIQSTPPGACGSVWNDPLVTASARLADILYDPSAELGLVRIEPRLSKDDAVPSFRLFTRKGTEIDWGPLGKNAAESNGTEDIKKKRLLDLVKQYGSLDAIPKNRQPIRL